MDINRPPIKKLKKLELLNLNESLQMRNKKTKIKIAAINNLNQTIKIGSRVINTPKMDVKPHKKIKKCK